MSNTTAQQSKIAAAINTAIPEHSLFKPTKAFYEEIRINKHRFAKLIKGKADPYLSELQAISSYFKIDISELI